MHSKVFKRIGLSTVVAAADHHHLDRWLLRQKATLRYRRDAVPKQSAVPVISIDSGSISANHGRQLGFDVADPAEHVFPVSQSATDPVMISACSIPRYSDQGPPSKRHSRRRRSLLHSRSFQHKTAIRILARRVAESRPSPRRKVGRYGILKRNRSTGFLRSIEAHLNPSEIKTSR
jgi:hypothetical protein